MSKILEIKDLSVSYGGIEAIKNISLRCRGGQYCHADRLQRRGQELTRSARLPGSSRQRAAEVLFEGENILGLSPDQIVKRGVTLVPEGTTRVPQSHGCRESACRRISAQGRASNADIEYVYELFPRLKERSWQFAGTLSGGEQQMLAVGRALMARPKLIMMDEPSLGLAPLVVQGIFDIIRTINKAGITVLLIEQNANMALKVADYAYVMQTGEIALSGTGAELLENEEVKEAYLGKQRK